MNDLHVVLILLQDYELFQNLEQQLLIKANQNEIFTCWLMHIVRLSWWFRSGIRQLWKSI